MHDIAVFCALDGLDESLEWKKCSPQNILTNAWWRMAVVLAQSTRVTYNIIEIIGYTIDIKEDGREKSSQLTAGTLYDMGEDFGTIIRYILDFHEVEPIQIGDWD